MGRGQCAPAQITELDRRRRGVWRGYELRPLSVGRRHLPRLRGRRESRSTHADRERTGPGVAGSLRWRSKASETSSDPIVAPSIAVNARRGRYIVSAWFTPDFFFPPSRAWFYSVETPRVYHRYVPFFSGQQWTLLTMRWVCTLAPPAGTWRTQWVDLCGDGDAACHYLYSNLYTVLYIG